MHSKSILKILREIGITVDVHTQKILAILEKHEIVNESYIADQLGMRINDVRKALYKLGNLGFVTYTKEKDEERKWWYVYNWQLDKAKIHYKYIQHLRDILHQREKELEREQQYVFQCRKCKRKYTYDDALNLNFLCEKCFGVLKEVKNKRKIMQISREIKELLEQIREEEALAKPNKERSKTAKLTAKGASKSKASKKMPQRTKKKAAQQKRQAAKKKRKSRTRRQR